MMSCSTLFAAVTNAVNVSSNATLVIYADDVSIIELIYATSGCAPTESVKIVPRMDI